MSRQSSPISRKDLHARRLRLAQAKCNPDWRWRKANHLPEESPDWSANDAFDLAERLLPVEPNQNDSTREVTP